MKVRWHETASLTEENPTLMGWSEMPNAFLDTLRPQPGQQPPPLILGGQPFVPCMMKWELPQLAENMATADQFEPILVLVVMRPEHVAAAQRTLALAQGGASLRHGASGPILDLNKLKGN